MWYQTFLFKFFYFFLIFFRTRVSLYVNGIYWLYSTAARSVGLRGFFFWGTFLSLYSILDYCHCLCRATLFLMPLKCLFAKDLYDIEGGERERARARERERAV